jgi:hypothetical protein
MSRLDGVQPDSRKKTPQLIQVWAFPNRQETVAPLKNEFTYCYPMTFGTSVYKEASVTLGGVTLIDSVIGPLPIESS